MEALHKYVPSFTTTKNVSLPNGEVYPHNDFDMLEVLIGGDQLTVTRAHSAIGIHRTHKKQVTVICSCHRGLACSTDSHASE